MAICETEPRHRMAIRKARINDVEGANGIAGCWHDWLVPAEDIAALATGEPRYGNGMLYDFYEPMIELATQRCVDSAFAQVVRGLAGVADERCRDPGLDALVYAELPLGRVWAFATWVKPDHISVEDRINLGDRSVNQVHGIFSSLGLEYDRQREARTVLLDTLCRRPDKPGSASRLLLRLVPIWQKLGYTHVLLYRHSVISAWKAGSDATIVDVPSGSNAMSARFFFNHAAYDLRQRISPYISRRLVASPRGYPLTYYVRSIEQWMSGRLTEVVAKCEADMRKQKIRAG